MRLKNPAFLGWVIEADVMQWCASGALSLIESGNGDRVQFTSKVEEPSTEFDPESLDDKKLAQSMLLPVGETRARKPSKWYQGGYCRYDIIFVKVIGANEEAILRFGQVAKSLTHSLKLQHFAQVVYALVAAGYMIVGLEIAFIVSKQKIESFRVTSSKVPGRGLLAHSETL